MSYQVIVFDWDGTLYDSAAYIVDCIQWTAKALQIKVPHQREICNVIGLSLEEAIKRAIPDLSSENVPSFKQKLYECISQEQFVKPTLFAGTEEILKQLSETGYWLAIATGKSRMSLENDLTSINLYSYFMTTKCADETFSKPHPQMLIEIIDELGVEPQQVLMIGDSEYDMQLAANANVDALAVNYGVHDEERLLLGSHVKGCLSDIRELPNWLIESIN